MKSRKTDIVREEVPNAVSSIVDRRCEGIIRWSCNYARFGTLNIDEIARSAYLQGFMDAYNALTKGEPNEPANGNVA